MIRISISNNLNKIGIIVSYVLKYPPDYKGNYVKWYLFRAILNLFLSPDKSLMAVGRWL